MFNRLFNLTATRVVLLVGALMAISLVALPVYNLAFAQEVIDYAENGMGSVAVFTAEDPEGADIVWSLSGDDAGDFTIEGGVLRFKNPPDFEDPKGGNQTNTYMVMVVASDGTTSVPSGLVTVMVTNEDEPGMVMLSTLQPQAGVDITASLTDPDGAFNTGASIPAADVMWQWARSSTMNGTYTNISGASGTGADAAMYTVKDVDVGMYLRATATYTDRSSTRAGANDRTKAAVSANAAQAEPRVNNKTPVFTPVETTRAVYENTPAGEPVGAPVVATDDDAVLTYTLRVDDLVNFDIDAATGQLLTKSDLDFETTPTYTVMVTATDPFGVPDPAVAGDTATVMINVVDVDEPPEVEGEDSVSFDELLGLGPEETLPSNPTGLTIDRYVGTYTATAKEETDNTIHTIADDGWDVSGADKSKFDIDEGVLYFKEAPDFEDSGDADGNNVYEVTVEVTDSGFIVGEKDVTVTVTNGDDDGKVTLSSGRPTVGEAITAMLTDADGGTSGIIWQWSKAATANAEDDDYMLIDGATSNTYTPVKTPADKTDVNMYLRAIAMYTGGAPADHPGGIKMAMKTADAPVVELVVDNRAPYFVGADGMPDRGRQQRRVDEDVVMLAVAAANAGNDDDGNAAAAVGLPIMAKDPDPGTTLEYTIEDPSDVFTIDHDTSQIRVIWENNADDLDFEDQATYTVTVTATDPGGLLDTTMVTIMVIDKDEAPKEPKVSTGSALTSDYAENGMGSVAVFTAEDPEGADIVWSLSGDDAGDFTIEGGVLRFKNPPDFEDPKGGNQTNTYMVMVVASDGTTSVPSGLVTVMVTNEDEPGMVMLSTLQPQAGVDITASLTDPDGAFNTGASIPAADVMWQWARSSTMNGTYTNISGASGTGADAAMYTVKDVDVGMYLRATATYTDRSSTRAGANDRTKAAVSANAAQARPRVSTSNKTPVFTPVETTKAVYENTPAGEPVGAPVVATDDDAVLTYTLRVDDLVNFDIDAATGQLLTKSDLDFETTPTYTVMVTATDPFGVPDPAVAGDTATVMINVVDVDEPPEVEGEDSVSFDELLGLGPEETLPSNPTGLTIDRYVGTYTATAKEETDNTIHTIADDGWDVSGADKSKFDIDEGVLYFKEAPDFEDSGDADGNNVYEVTVEVTDSGFIVGEKDVTVTVTNGDDDGKVTLSSGRPTVGEAITAMLTDADGGTSGIIWQWSKAATANAEDDDYMLIDGATSNTYTPVKTPADKTDVNMYLRAIAMYTGGAPADHPGGIKMAMKTADAPVVELVVDNRAPYFVGADGMPDRGRQQRRVDEDVVMLAVAAANAGNDDDGNAAAAVGLPIMAKDPDPGTTLEYTIEDPSDVFTIDHDTSQIRVIWENNADDLDFEDQATYTVTVTATDLRGLLDTTMVTIMVIDKDEAPEMPEIMKVDPGQGLTISGRSSRSYAENGTGSVATYTATGAVGSVTWTLGGDDMDDFNISTSGRLTFMDPPDYEMPMDRDTNNVYMVTVMAGDGISMDEHDVMVTVTDVVGDEMVEPPTDTTVPEQFVQFDTDGESGISRDEVLDGIDAFIDGGSGNTRDDILDLIDYFLDNLGS